MGIGVHTVTDAFRYWVAGWKQWLALGLLAGLVEGGLVALRMAGPASSTVTSDKKLKLAEPGVLVLNFTSQMLITVVGFWIAGALVRAAVAQIQGRGLGLSHAAISGRQMTALAILGASTQASSYASWLVLGQSAAPVAGLVLSLMQIVGNVLFLITIPLVVVQDKGPIEAAQTSVWLMKGCFWQALGMLLLIGVTLALCMMPFMLLSPGLELGKGQAGMVVGAAMALVGVLWIPWYYLFVGLVYEDVAVVRAGDDG